MITLSGPPLSTQHIYLQKGKMRFMKKESKERKESYQWEAKSQWRKKVLVEELSISIKLFFGDKRKRDWDNYHKLSMDALSGIVWVDDSQIKKCLVEVFIDNQNPRIEVNILDP
jgi:crossover junction endodeoxyribonuclease RusA